MAEYSNINILVLLTLLDLISVFLPNKKKNPEHIQILLLDKTDGQVFAEL